MSYYWFLPSSSLTSIASLEELLKYRSGYHQRLRSSSLTLNNYVDCTSGAKLIRTATWVLVAPTWLWGDRLCLSSNAEAWATPQIWYKCYEWDYPAYPILFVLVCLCPQSPSSMWTGVINVNLPDILGLDPAQSWHPPLRSAAHLCILMTRKSAV